MTGTAGRRAPHTSIVELSGMMRGPLLKPIREPVSSSFETAFPQTSPKSALVQDNRQAMSGEPLQRIVVITNPQGFHMRPISAFVQLATQFQSNVYLYNQTNERFDGKSPLSLLGLGAEQGTELKLEVIGPDQEAALEALAQLFTTITHYDSESCEDNGGKRQ